MPRLFPESTSIFGSPGEVQSYEGRAVFVPHGFTAAEIWDAAKMLEREFDIAPYTSQHMAVAVLVTAANASPQKVEAEVVDHLAEQDQEIA